MGNSGSNSRRRGNDEETGIPPAGTSQAFFTPQQMQAMLMMRHFGAPDQDAGPPPPEVQQTYTLQNVLHLKKKSLQLVPVDAATGKFLLRFEVDLLTPCTIVVRLDCEEFLDESTGSIEYNAAWRSPPLALDKGMNQLVGGEENPSHREHCLLDLSLLPGENLVHHPNTSRYPVLIELREVERVDKEDGPGAAAAQPRAQTSYATLDVSEPEAPAATVLKQKIQVDGLAYEVQEIFGIEQNAAAAAGDESVLCVVCLTNPVNTMCLPCRHMCMCDECANALRLQSNRCPVCRTQIDTFLQVEVAAAQQAAAEGAAAHGAHAHEEVPAAT